MSGLIAYETGKQAYCDLTHTAPSPNAEELTFTMYANGSQPEQVIAALKVFGLDDDDIPEVQEGELGGDHSPDDSRFHTLTIQGDAKTRFLEAWKQYEEAYPEDLTKLQKKLQQQRRNWMDI